MRQRLIDMWLPGTHRRLSLSCVAEALGVSKSTVLDWIRKGWLRAAQPAPPKYPTWRIRRGALRKAVRDNPHIAAMVMERVGELRSEPDSDE